jgi:hypothetical protein
MSDIVVIDQDEKIFRERLAGKSVRRIAREFGRSVEEVSAVISRMCQPISPEMRKQVLQLDLERLDELQQVFYEKAREGDASSAWITIKISERRSALLGLDIPAQLRADPVQLTIATAPETSTDRIRRALDGLLAQRPALPNGNGSAEEEPEPGSPGPPGTA